MSRLRDASRCVVRLSASSQPAFPIRNIASATAGQSNCGFGPNSTTRPEVAELGPGWRIDKIATWKAPQNLCQSSRSSADCFMSPTPTRTHGRQASAPAAIAIRIKIVESRN